MVPSCRPRRPLLISHLPCTLRDPRAPSNSVLLHLCPRSPTRPARTLPRAAAAHKGHREDCFERMTVDYPEKDSGLLRIERSDLPKHDARRIDHRGRIARDETQPHHRVTALSAVRRTRAYFRLFDEPPAVPQLLTGESLSSRLFLPEPATRDPLRCAPRRAHSAGLAKRSSPGGRPSNRCVEAAAGETRRHSF